MEPLKRPPEQSGERCAVDNLAVGHFPDEGRWGLWIVLNIENLYSIGAVEEEIELATAYYRSIGMESEIVNEHFKVIDEVRDCRELFAKLEETLVAS